MLQNFYLTFCNIVNGSNNQNIVLVSTSCRTDCIKKKQKLIFFSKHKKDIKSAILRGPLASALAIISNQSLRYLCGSM